MDANRVVYGFIFKLIKQYNTICGKLPELTKKTEEKIC